MTQYVARGLFALYRTGVRDIRRESKPFSPRTVLIARSLFLVAHYGLIAAALVLFGLVTDAAFNARFLPHVPLFSPF
jgi:hypothetical protein